MNAEAIETNLAIIRRAVMTAMARGDCDVTFEDEAGVDILPPVPPSNVCGHRPNGNRAFTVRITPRVATY
jgi:hypothetical protein